MGGEGLGEVDSRVRGNDRRDRARLKRLWAAAGTVLECLSSTVAKNRRTVDYIFAPVSRPVDRWPVTGCVRE